MLNIYASTRSGEIQTGHQRVAQNADSQMSHQGMKFSFSFPHLFADLDFLTPRLVLICLADAARSRGCVQLGRSCRATPQSWQKNPSPKLGAVLGSQPLCQTWNCIWITAPLPNLQLLWGHSPSAKPAAVLGSQHTGTSKCSSVLREACRKMWGFFPKLTLPLYQES